MIYSQYLQTIRTNPGFQLVHRTYSHDSQALTTAGMGGALPTARRANATGERLSLELRLPHLTESGNAIIGHRAGDGRTITFLKISPAGEIATVETLNLQRTGSGIMEILSQWKNKNTNLFILSPDELRSFSEKEFRAWTGQPIIQQ